MVSESLHYNETIANKLILSLQHRGFEACAKLAQQWLVCVPLRIHLEPINKRVNAVSDNIIIINCAIWPKENYAVPNRKLREPIAGHMGL